MNINFELESFFKRLSEIQGNLTDGELSEKLGINRTTILKLRKVGNPSTAVVVAFAKHLKISPNWLLLGVGQKYLNEYPDPDEELTILRDQLSQTSNEYNTYKKKVSEHLENLKKMM